MQSLKSNCDASNCAASGSLRSYKITENDPACQKTILLKANRRVYILNMEKMNI